MLIISEDLKQLVHSKLKSPPKQ